MSDVGDVASRRLSFWHGGDGDMGNWIPHLLRRTDLHRERCVVLGARPSAARRRAPYFDVARAERATSKG